MTLQEYSSFVVYDQYKWQLAYKQQQVLPVEWRTLIYRLHGSEAEERQFAEYFKFSRKMLERWTCLNAQDKTNPVLNVFKTAEYLTVCYTVWNGRVYLPSEKVRYENLPQLNNCTVGNAIRNGLLNQVADNEQFKVVDMIWSSKSVQPKQ